MPPSQYIVLTHGGAGSDPAFKDGTDRAAQACLNHLKTGTPLIDAVCHAVSLLEGDTRFNAGLGSHPRSDGSVQMDAAVMDDQENFGAVAALEGYANAIHIAR
ncbi:MAG: isoaspartyl peptidase/L-asparaginase, partial [Nitrospinaceae bacterium]